MANSKYDPDTFPLRAKELARDGFSDKQIYQQLGICKDTYYRYIKKYSDFSDALREGRKPINILVENALLQRCLGYEYEETSTSARTIGKKKKVVEQKIKRTTKTVLPHVGACQNWLRTKKPEQWKDQEVAINLKGFESFADLMISIYEKEKKESKK